MNDVEIFMKFCTLALIAFLAALHLRAQSDIDYKQTTLSDVDLYVSNNGIIGYNSKQGMAGLLYPRGSQNQYLFGSGTWFGAKKRVSNILRNLVIRSYNLSSGKSWMTPGNMGDPDSLSQEMINQYQVERSTDFTQDGLHAKNQMPPWSLWKTAESDESGIYVPTIDKRNSAVYPQGVAMVSDEMFHSRYHDSNLARYERSIERNKKDGYPLGLHFDEKIFTWKNSPLHSSIIVQKTITNSSTDTLFDCYIACVFDPDIRFSNNLKSFQNDNIRSINTDNTQVFFAWTNTDQGEQGKNFGYLMAAYLETPAINNDSLRTSKSYNHRAPISEQIGTYSVKLYTSVGSGLSIDDYTFITEKDSTSYVINMDIRALLCTGSFTLLPGQSTRIAYCISIVDSLNGKEPEGSNDDIPIILKKLQQIQQVYSTVSDYTLKQQETIDRILAPNPANTTVIINSSEQHAITIQAISVLGEIFPVEYSVLSAESLQCSIAHLPQGYYTLILSSPTQSYSYPLHVIR